MILSKVVERVFKEHLKAVEDAKTMEEAVHYLAGLVLKETGGKALMPIVYEEVRRRLASYPL